MGKYHGGTVYSDIHHTLSTGLKQVSYLFPGGISGTAYLCPRTCSAPHAVSKGCNVKSVYVIIWTAYFQTGGLGVEVSLHNVRN